MSNALKIAQAIKTLVAIHKNSIFTNINI